jgi:hypothetical protein
MMRQLIVGIVLLLGCGCSSYTAAQVRLVAQARKGVAVWAGRETARDDEVRRAYRARREALDRAFDGDVRLQKALDPDWVIEARKGYAAGLAAVGEAEATALANNDAARRDAAATDAALAKLEWLMSIQLDVEHLIEKGGQR